jgi:hypothetical protein
MKKYISLSVLVIFSLFFWQAVKAADTATIGATVTAQNLSLSVASGVITYGNVALNTSTTTAGNGYTQIVTNEGSTMALNAKSSNATGGTTWTIGASSGSDIFVHEISTTTGSTYMKFTAADTYLTASSSMMTGVSNTQALDFRLTTPTASTDFLQKSITITVQASAI